MSRGQIVIGADLSFRGSGFAIARDGQFCDSVLLQSQVDSVTGYLKCLQASFDLMQQINDRGLLFQPESIRDRYFVVEMPPPKSQFSPGLYMLTGLVISLFKSYEYRVFVCSNLLVKSVIGSKKATKKDACKFIRDHWLAGELGLEYWNDKFDIVQDHNLAEALIILSSFSYLNKWGIFPTFENFLTEQAKKVNFWEFIEWQKKQ